MDDENKKVDSMSIENLQAEFERQDKRQNSQAESITTLVELQATATSNIAMLIDVVAKAGENNKQDHDRTREEIEKLRESKNKTLLPATLIIIGIMVSISGVGITASWLVLTPISQALAEHSRMIDSNHAETRAMVQGLRESDTAAKVERAVIIERHTQEQRMNRAWVDPTGRIAFPSMAN